MDEDEKRAEETLTEGEREQMDETGETPEEAHRAGEYEALSAKLDIVTEKLDGIADSLGKLADAWKATAVDDGAEFRDIGGDGDVDEVSVEVEAIPDLDDMDLDI